VKRRPCPTCPWRRSTRRRGFPGGIIDAEGLLGQLDGSRLTAMQCHCTPDGAKAEVCVGFALVVGAESVGLRLAVALGLVAIDDLEADAPLHTVSSLLRMHGGRVDARP